MARFPRRTGVAAVALAAVLAMLAGCSSQGIYGVPLPGGAATDEDAYRVTIQFRDVLDLVPQAAVKVDDVTVGGVEEIRLSGFTAEVVVRVASKAKLPDNAVAQIRQTSLLGEKFVSLGPPARETAVGSLSDGDVIPLARSGRNAEVEEVLSALSLLLGGGGVDQIRTINRELKGALAGREANLRNLLTQLDRFVGGLNDQKADIVRALDALDRLAGTLNAQKKVIETALTEIGPGLKVLADQRGQLTAMLRALDRLGAVGVRVINASQADVVADLRALQPILQNLVAAGTYLPRGLEMLLSYPFPRTVVERRPGRLHQPARHAGPRPAQHARQPGRGDAGADRHRAGRPGRAAAAAAGRGGPAAHGPVPARPDAPSLTARPVDRRAAPMIPRRVKLQVTAFVVLAALGVAFVGVRYVGLGDTLFGRTYLVHADFAESGGIFTNAAVTYRGVQVGRVGDLRLRPDGVRVSLRLDRGVQVPADTRAVVTNRSAVGEQYVDLRPPSGNGPFLGADDVIPLQRTSGPLAVEVVLLHLDELVRSVDTEDLRVVVDELGKAFDGTGPALRGLIDDGDALLAAATESLPQTIALIRDGQTVLDTQVASSSAIRSWADSLAQLSATLRSSDADLRRLLANGPVATSEVVLLLRDLRPAVGMLLGNLITVGQIQSRRVNGLEQILATYPGVVAGSFTVAPGDGTAHFGLVINFDDPAPCVYGKRDGRYACTDAERARGAVVRGWQNAPRPGSDAGPAPLGPPVQDPGVLPGTVPGTPALTPQQLVAVAGYDPATGLAVGPDGQPIQLGTTGGQQQVLGEQSWKALLLGPLAG